MSISFRSLLGLAIALVISSCGSKKSTTTTTSADSTVIIQPVKKAIPRARNEVSDSMLAEITRYYNKEYGTDTAAMTIGPSDTIVELSFADVSSDTDAYHGTLFVAYVSRVTDLNPVLRGDMNGDGVDDLLVTVHTEGGGGGGNVWWSDHFLFLGDRSGQYHLADTKSDGDLIDGSGYFFPREIANQTITGIGNAYNEDDGHCCPSLYYRMHVRLTGGQLKTIDQTAIAKPADFE